MKNTSKAHPRSLAPKYPGITEAARVLSVSRTHLYLVLSGKRTSDRLLARYKKLNQSAA